MSSIGTINVALHGWVNGRPNGPKLIINYIIFKKKNLKKNEERKDVFEQNPSKVLTESEQSPSIIDKIVEVELLRLSLDCLQTPQSPLGVHTEYVSVKYCLYITIWIW